jgi:hypothetical protein
LREAGSLGSVASAVVWQQPAGTADGTSQVDVGAIFATFDDSRPPTADSTSSGWSWPGNLMGADILQA